MRSALLVWVCYIQFHFLVRIGNIRVHGKPNISHDYIVALDLKYESLSSEVEKKKKKFTKKKDTLLCAGVASSGSISSSGAKINRTFHHNLHSKCQLWDINFLFRESFFEKQFPTRHSCDSPCWNIQYNHTLAYAILIWIRFSNQVSSVSRIFRQTVCALECSKDQVGPTWKAD